MTGSAAGRLLPSRAGATQAPTPRASSLASSASLQYPVPSGGRLRHDPERLFQLVEQGDQAVLLRCPLAEALGDDDPVLPGRRQPRVAAWLEALRRGLHDPALRVRRVALGLRGGLAQGAANQPPFPAGVGDAGRLLQPALGRPDRLQAPGGAAPATGRRRARRPLGRLAGGLAGRRSRPAPGFRGRLRPWRLAGLRVQARLGFPDRRQPPLAANAPAAERVLLGAGAPPWGRGRPPAARGRTGTGCGAPRPGAGAIRAPSPRRFASVL